MAEITFKGGAVTLIGQEVKPGVLYVLKLLRNPFTRYV